MEFVSAAVGIFLVAAASLVFDSWRALRRAASSLKGIPGPKPSWPAGTAHLLRGKDGELRISEVYTQLREKYGKIFSFFLAKQPVVVVSDVAAIKEITVTRFKNFHDRPRFATVMSVARSEALSNGIAVARGGLWASIKGALQPIFHTVSLERYSEFMNDVAGQTVETIQTTHLDGQPFNISDPLHNAGLNIIFKCAYGINLSEQDEQARSKLLEAGEKMFSTLGPTSAIQRIITMLPKPLQFLGERLAFLCLGSPVSSAQDTLFSMVQQLAENYCAAHPELGPWQKDRALLGRGAGLKLLTEGTVPSDNSVLAACIRARDKTTGKPLTPRTVMMQGMMFVVAGYETSATTMTLATYLISKHPDVEQKLLEEIRANGADAEPRFERLEEDWKYAKAIVYETLRLLPLAPVISRQALEDCWVAGKHVPAGTVVHVPVSAVHRDKENWAEPDAFRPERFIEDPKAALSPKFLGFGFGPRACIGWRFATEEAVTLLVRMYQKYTFRLCPEHHPNGEVEWRQSFFLKAKSGIWVIAEERNH